MSKLTKKLSFGAETDVETMTGAFDHLRKDLLMLEPPPDAAVKLSVTVVLQFSVQQRLPIESARRDRELAHIG